MVSFCFMMENLIKGIRTQRTQQPSELLCERWPKLFARYYKRENPKYRAKSKNESLSLRQEKPQLNYQLRFFSYIRLSASSIASQWYYFVVILPLAVKSYIGEYNITVSVANNITFAKQKYHSALAEYYSIQFNLRITLSARKKHSWTFNCAFFN